MPEIVRNAANITRWIAPWSTVVRPMARVMVAMNRESTSNTMCSASSPSASGLFKIKVSKATQGMVRQMLARALIR